MEKKEVKMEVQENVKKKLSYEELENVCHQLSEQSRALYQKLQDSNMVNLFKRLDYLFEVVKIKDMFPKKFVEECVDEIMTSLTIPKEENTDTTEE